MVTPLFCVKHLWRTNLKTTPLFQPSYAVVEQFVCRCFCPRTQNKKKAVTKRQPSCHYLPTTLNIDREDPLLQF